jgi:biotin carboxyl carrier protein
VIPGGEDAATDEVPVSPPAPVATDPAPPGSPAPVATVTIPATTLRRLVVGVRVLSVLLAVALCALVVTLPRSVSYRGLMDENLTLRTALGDVETRLAELDRLMLRLRLYDAEMRSLAEPTGDHGPVPDDVFANAGLDGPDLSSGGLERLTGDDLPMDVHVHPSEEWATSVSARLTRALDHFSRAEPDVSLVLSELEEMRAFEKALPTAWPTTGIPSSGFGWRRSPFNRRWKFHSGLDVANDRGTPIRAPSAGTVVKAEYHAGYGRMLLIDHGFGITTLYGHCQSLRVGVGDVVQRGQIIATMGNTGQSTGPHLHFEVHQDGHPVDPLTYLRR